VLERWATGLDLRLINTDAKPTCVRTNGSSIIDLTWSSPDICSQITDWWVLSDEISLSDHRYIAFRIGGLLGGATSGRVHHKRWNIKTLDRKH